MARKTKEDAERTYHALLDAAAELFIRQGVSRTTLSDIAHEAGLTRGAVYWHFRNKDSVIEALWARNARRLQEAFEQLETHARAADPVPAFRQAIHALIRRVVEEPELGQITRIVMHVVEFTDEQNALQRFLNDRRDILHDHMRAAFEILGQRGVLRNDLSPSLLAEGLLAYIYGLVHSDFSPGEPVIDLARNGRALIDLYLDSIFSGPGACVC
ncbi:MAG: TetR family transcriptional regulator [Gammaproteobacteria bacterium]|nr:MAG: TetR family transcriptional regulator [Gammaproteobacteria bacterium]